MESNSLENIDKNEKGIGIKIRRKLFFVDSSNILFL